MKKNFVRSELVADNVDRVTNMGGKSGRGLPLSGLLFLIAEVLDGAADGDNAYITIGCSRDRTQILATITWEGIKAYAAGANIEELSQQMWNLTDASTVSDKP